MDNKVETNQTLKKGWGGEEGQCLISENQERGRREQRKQKLQETTSVFCERLVRLINKLLH